METYINLLFDKFIELRGDRIIGDDKSVVGGLGWIEDKRVVLIAPRLEKLRENRWALKPEAYRKGLRLICLAEHFKRPITALLAPAPLERELLSSQEAYPLQKAAFDNVQKLLFCSIPILAISFSVQNHWGVLGSEVCDKIIKFQQPIDISDSDASALSNIRKTIALALSELETLSADELIQRRRDLI